MCLKRTTKKVLQNWKLSFVCIRNKNRTCINEPQQNTNMRCRACRDTIRKIEMRLDFRRISIATFPNCLVFHKIYTKLPYYSHVLNIITENPAGKPFPSGLG